MFKLTFDIPPATQKINLKDPILLMGSCFTQHIGNFLSENKFDVLSNPFGNIYNPYSIFHLLEGDVSATETVKSQDIYYHWDAHGDISSMQEQEVVDLFLQRMEQTTQFLKKAKWLIITPGTSFVYLLDSTRIVANCHKVPSSQFHKRLLRPSEIIEKFEYLNKRLSDLNPSLQILFTISPVRHIRDGLVQNNRSKAILIDAIHQITETFSNTAYFPSYEIVIDELRDYRFYAEDMIHPSHQAVKYIWERFAASFMDENTRTFLDEWQKVKAALDHRPEHPSSLAHRQFLKKTLEKLEKLNEKVDMSVEIEKIKRQIK